ncbi:MAG: phytanoyl-CoA dioxygenase family protein [Algicola sp.]|nr:phytanoyl-CoA dioxygenase family protein [Algicola sp.]
MRNPLTDQQRQSYHHNGFLFPISVLSDKEVAYFRSQHDALDQGLGGKTTPQQKSQCHLRFKWASDLATHPAILDAVEAIIGANILIHSSTIFCKYARDESWVSWHQDSFYWGLSAPKLVSAWIALTDSTIDNGCLRVLKGTQSRRYQHTEKPQKHNMLGKGLTVFDQLNTDEAQDIVLAAGEMSFHHAHIVHSSQPNTSDQPRIGFAVRYVSTAVTQQKPHHNVILARGEDHYGHYQIQNKPTQTINEGLSAQNLYDGDPQRNY